MSSDVSTTSAVRPLWRVLSWAFMALLLLYLAIVLPFDRALPFVNRWYAATLIFVLLGVATFMGLRNFVWRQPDANEMTKNVVMLSATLLFSLLAADIGFTALSNTNRSFRTDQSALLDTRKVDVNVWDGELMPALYRPTDENFWLYKPEQTKVAMVYGEHYYADLSSHAVLRDSVLERQRVAFLIDRYGLRNTDEPSSTGTFALGDSFCFGYHTSQEATFASLMKPQLGEAVYNMGVSSTSPLQQLLIFKHLLRTHADVFKPRRLLWLIFEGNDLEESYDVKFPVERVGALSRIFAGTIVEGLSRGPTIIRQESVIRLMTGGDIVLTGRLNRKTVENHYQLDGQTLAYPLYHSARFGYRLFRQSYLDRASEPASYVLNHPNLPRLAETFQSMKALAREKNFEVTIVIVPSDVRLYGRYFDDMPPLSKEPYFINAIIKLATEAGFALIDLNTVLAPYAEKELLHYRDDTHWNKRGHEIVAGILARHLKGRSADRARDDICCRGGESSSPSGQDQKSAPQHAGRG